MIITCKKNIPLHWIIFAILPWAAVNFNAQVMGTAFLFSLKKFIDNPAGLTSILSLPSLIALVSGPLCNFLSDRVWTRFGRRKPFIAVSWTGIIVCLVLMPLMPNFWALLAVYIAYSVLTDIGSPIEALNQEVVPPHQRGRATAGMQWCSNLVAILFFVVALGRFDDVKFMAGVPIYGEQAIYWSAGLLVTIMLLLVTLGIKETSIRRTSPSTSPARQGVLGSILDPQLWPVYSLAFGSAMLASGLGALSNLLYTDQFGYTKQDMGINVGVGGTLNLCLILALGIVADKLPRLRAYQVLISIALLIKVAYYCYVEFILPDGRPSLVEIILFGEMMSIVSILTNMVYSPLVYDYVPRNRLGTYGAGASIVTRLTQLVTLNGVGLFVWAYALVFQAPAGDRVQVVLRQEARTREIAAVVKRASWRYPENGTKAPASAVDVRPRYATGLVTDSGRCWEIRLRDKAAEHLNGEKEQLEKERSVLIGKTKLLTDEQQKLLLNGKGAQAGSLVREIDAGRSRIASLSAEIDAKNARIRDWSDKLRSQVVQVFGSKILADGEQVLDATVQNALLIELPAYAHPVSAKLESALRELRRNNPGIIDLRPRQHANGYGVSASVMIRPGDDMAKAALDLQKALEQTLEACHPGLVKPGDKPLSTETHPALGMDLLVVEDPLITRISPVTRGVNWVLSRFGTTPTADRRLLAMERSLRIPGQIDHVRIEPGPQPKSIRVNVVLQNQLPQSESATDSVARRFKELLGDNGNALTAHCVYDHILDAAALQRLTVERPFVTTGYASMRYDYMAGFILMFILGVIGLCISVAFARRERRGLIRKHGVEEAQQANVASAPGEDSVQNPDFCGETAYTPRHVRRKIGMVAFGLAVLSFGIIQISTPARLVLFGDRATAQATRVIKSKPGQPDVILTNNLQLQAAAETADRSYIFRNEFQFQTADGRQITVTLPIQSLLRPIYSITDEDGLATTVPICYDQRQPENVVYPSVISTWFMPAVLVVCGILCSTIGAVLLYWANKPIEHPLAASLKTETLGEAATPA